MPQFALTPLTTRNATAWRDPWYDWCDHVDLRPRDPHGWRACWHCGCSIPPEWQEYPTAEYDPGIVDSVLDLIRRGMSWSTAFGYLGVDKRLSARWMRPDCDEPGAAHLRALVARARAQAKGDIERRMYLEDPQWWALNCGEREGRPGVEPGEGFGPAPKQLDVKTQHSGGIRVDVSRLAPDVFEALAAAGLAAIEEGEVVDVTPGDPDDQ